MMMRYLPHTSQDVEEMLNVIGVSSIEELFQSIPKESRLKKPLDLPNSLSEMALRNDIESLAQQNLAESYTHFLGGGCYDHYIPSIVNYLGNQGHFLTAYTPYQPEISQGTLQVTFEFQTMIARLTGMEVANACMYDGATSLAEACLMAKRLYPEKRSLLISRGVHPEYIEVCKTYLQTQEVDLLFVPYDAQTGQVDKKALQQQISDETVAVVVQSPNFLGVIEDLESIRSLLKNSLFIVGVTEPLSLALLKSPGRCGADIVCGEAQSFGNPPSYGGPHVGFFATKNVYVRSLPGRIVGETIDKDGKRCYTLTLSTREQHIRREKATSNICTNEALLATRSTIYLSTLGEKGLRELAQWNHTLANELSERISKKAKRRFLGPFFNEITFDLPTPISKTMSALEKKKILGGIPLEKYYPELKSSLLMCTTEVCDLEDIDRLASAL